MNKIKLIKVWTESRTEDQPDLSHLGEYTNDGSKAGAIARENCGSREYRFFVPAMTGEETGNLESPRQDFERMEAYNRGDWCMIGICAKAEVVLTGNAVQTIHSGGLWGVESDSGDEYLNTVKEEEADALAAELAALGVGKRAIAYAMRRIEHKDR